MSIPPRLSSWAFWGLVLVLTCGSIGTTLAPPDVIRVGAFSEASPDEHYPPGWTLYGLVNGHKKTKYNLVDSERGTVVRARSDGAIASLHTEHRVDPTAYPILEWSWKVDQLQETAHMRKRGQNDYTASVVVRFDHTDLGLRQRLMHFTMRVLGYNVSPNRLLIYFWATQVERGSVFEGLYVDWHTQVAIRSGSTRVGSWITERRNIRKDYRSIFGEGPPPILSVSLLTKSSQTGENVTAYYGDILFRTSADSLIGPTLKTERVPE